VAYVENVDLVPVASRNAPGNQASQSNFGGSTQAVVLVRVSEISSNATLNVVLEDSIDGVNWFRVDQASMYSRVDNFSLRTREPFSDNLRVSWYFGGSSPSATFGVSLAAF
jgi:hypothetical protein